MTLVLFLIVIAVLIFVHELGHFIAARAFGIKVSEFALGFGPKLWSYTKGETKYALNLIPFGGYVKIFGENPDEESISGPESARSFVNKPKWQQITVLAAGVFFNFVFAGLLMIVAYGVGVPASLESYPQYADRIENPHIAIIYVEPKSPAEIAGLKPADTILGYERVEDVQAAIAASGGKEITLKTIRNGVLIDRILVPQQGIVEGKYAIGISMDNAGTLQLPPHLAIYEGTRFTFHMMKEITKGLYGLIAGMFTGDTSFDSVSGPVGIAGYVKDAASIGFTYLMMFTALISINLGVLNLVPFPALDGGRILFVIIEAIMRRPIKPVVANAFNAVGFFLLILLMVVVTYKDIIKMFVK